MEGNMVYREKNGMSKGAEGEFEEPQFRRSQRKTYANVQADDGNSKSAGI